MAHGEHVYDVAIIGSGMGGATLGTILARHGLRVLIFESGVHPRFAVGESMILETSETMRAMAELFDVPELAYFSSEHFFNHVGTSHGVKRHFSYLHHREGQTQNADHTIQAVIPKAPHGHELHIFRQDSDYLMTTTAIAYGATVLQNTPVKSIAVEAGGVTIETVRGEQYQAAYLVDAGGFRSLLADKFGWRSRELQAHSRTIFTHMLNVPCYNSVGATREQYGVPFRFSEGTLHHVFHGGWLWVIPFNNHARATNPLVSVGLQLDPRIHPLRADLTPEEEFYDFIARFPGIAPQFAEARAVRNWTRTERLQYTATQIVGDRCCLLGHAAGFIDPLYSKGLYITLMSTALLAHLLLDAHRDGDYSAARFMPLQRLTQRYVAANDRLVANSFKSWSNQRLWSAYSVQWMLGAYLELVYLISARSQARDRHAYFARIDQLQLTGGGFAEFLTIADWIDTLVENLDPADETLVTAAVAEIRARYSAPGWVPQPFKEILNGKKHLPANKLRLSLFDRDKGFLGSGAYREHFFGQGSYAELVSFFLRDTLRYATPTLDVQRRTAFKRTLLHR
ncbi:MAG: NAD(P)-binding protein [Oscillochloris sp.]|nr:NAD(P)-binding protein [Oscillochloris sp.]